jgi:DNA-directed RNA polymerase subunit RPC12/RpoP
MPVGACDRCSRLYVLNTEHLPQIACPRCRQRLRLDGREKPLAHLLYWWGKSRQSGAETSVWSRYSDCRR